MGILLGDWNRRMFFEKMKQVIKSKENSGSLCEGIPEQCVAPTSEELNGENEWAGESELCLGGRRGMPDDNKALVAALCRNQYLARPCLSVPAASTYSVSPPCTVLISSYASGEGLRVFIKA